MESLRLFNTLKPITGRFRGRHSSLLLLIASLALLGCEPDDHGHAHGEETHEAHADEYDTNERPTHVVTLFGEHTEFFVEFPAFVAGKESKFAAHFTTLDDYQPVRKGSLSTVLTSPDSPGENWTSEAPTRAGIFTPVATPKYAGKRQLILTLKTEAFTDTFKLGEFEVFKDIEAARKNPIETPEGGVSFLKEQQWMVDFDLTQVALRSMRPSVRVNANLRPAANGEAAVTAPFDGRISAPNKDAVVQVGQQVEAGEVLAYVLPRLDAGELTQLRAELRKAKVELNRAQRDVDRVQRLAKSGAIALKRVQDSESSRDIAQADVDQAQQRLRQSQNLESRGGGSGRIAIRSPIDGMVAERTVVDGGFVSRSDALFRVVDRSKMWLEAHIPEADLPRIGQPTGVWFEPGGDLGPVEIDLESGGELVSFGEVIDPVTRTAPLIFAIGDDEAQQSLRVGSFVKAHIYSDAPREALSIPASAVLDEKGLDVVFVMKNGESFERRIVRLGIRDGEQVEVLDGLSDGEYVVSEGVYYVKLASMSTGSVGHGHAH